MFSPIAALLPPDDVALVKRCMKAVLEGPWIASCCEFCELHTRSGLTTSEFRDAVTAWPGDTPHQAQAVRAALLEVGLGIRFTADEWNDWIGSSREEVRALFYRVRDWIDARSGAT